MASFGEGASSAIECRAVGGNKEGAGKDGGKTMYGDSAGDCGASTGSWGAFLWIGAEAILYIHERGELLGVKVICH